jgi:hypothetical protein
MSLPRGSVAKWRIATLNGEPHILKVKGSAYELALEELVTNEPFCAKIFGNTPRTVLARANRVLAGVNRKPVSKTDRKFLQALSVPYENTISAKLLSILRGQLGDNFDM